MSEYTYDDTNAHFPFFMVTLVGIVIVPLTYNVLQKSTDLEKTGEKVESDYKPQDEDIIQAQRRKQKKQERKTKRIIALVIGYAFMAWMFYLIVTTQRVLPKMWDPYDILGVKRSATEKEIDKFYKRLSIRYHPDKARPDASKNETLETVNDRWVEMTKAYKALTDEDIRNNYLMYGNPDGKQSTSWGIAIPKWVVEGNSRSFVLLFYAGLLGVFLPYTVGKWWYGTQAITKDKVLYSSAGKMFKEWKEDMKQGAVLAALSTGDEYKEALGAQADHASAKLETKVLSSGLLSPDDVRQLRRMEDPLRRKVLALLWAYVGRLDLDDVELNRQKYEVAPIARHLLSSFTNITLPFQIVEPLMNTYRVSQRLIQAMPPNASPLLQLPNFTPELVQKISASSKAPIDVQKFMALPSQTRRSLCSDLSESQYQQAVKVASQMPHFEVAKVFFKVVGERVVTPSSLVQMVVKGRIIPPGTDPKTIPNIFPSDLEDVDPVEGDLDALHGRKSKTPKFRKTPDGMKEDDAEDGSTQPPLAHGPFYAADHAPRWHIFLSEAKVGRIAVPPFTFTSFDRAIFHADGRPTFNMLTLRCQFQAPPQVHAFPFTMNMICDSYVGFDSKVDVILDVRDVSETQVVDSEEEISEPDEDTLAGQLQAMKTGQAPPPRKIKKSIKDEDEDEESDDGSDTDGDVQDDQSETDTETEDES